MKDWKQIAAVAVAGVMMTGSVGFAQQTNDRPGAPGTPPAQPGQPGSLDRPAGQQPGQGQAGQGRAGQGQAGQEGHGQMGQQADQQVKQQMQKIGQSSQGAMACDKLFVLEAGLGSQFEMELSRLAERKSQNDQVKQLAQQIMQDHMQATQQLQPIAQKLQVELPQGLTSMKQQKLQIYESLDAKAFDREFISTMDVLHAKDVAHFRNVSKTAATPEVKQFASQTLPKLQQHHQAIRRAGPAVGLELSDMNEAQPAGGRIPASDSPSRTPTPGIQPPDGSPAPRPDPVPPNRQ